MRVQAIGYHSPRHHGPDPGGALIHPSRKTAEAGGHLWVQEVQQAEPGDPGEEVRRGKGDGQGIGVGGGDAEEEHAGDHEPEEEEDHLDGYRH